MRLSHAIPLLVLTLPQAGCADPAPDSPTTLPTGDLPADVVVAWNARILDVAEAEDGFLTLKGVRTASMMHLAMHDALASIDRRFQPWSEVEGAADVDPVAAANAAAHAVAVTQYPDQDSIFEVERTRWTPPGSTSEGAIDRAAVLGSRVAASVMATRGNDGWDADPAYAWHPMGPGVYAEFNEHSGTPEGFVFGAGWAEARPFVLDSASQFRSEPPPDIESNAYTRAFDEVKDVGRHASATRTPDQTHLAMWWKEFVEKSHNRLARELTRSDSLDLWDAARMFALLNMSIFDGYVASFDGKFHYNHWRPYTAIRWASNDGNPDTEEDPEWTNLHDHTYAFPSYPSAHGTVCGSAMTVLASVFGEDRPFDMTIREVDEAGPFSAKVPMNPPTRSFASFAAAADECGLSRVYLGIHFRYDSEAGVRLGRQIGRWALSRALSPTQSH